jgi:lipoprotein-anchoring transpeptidase ErfK/SrfK
VAADFSPTEPATLAPTAAASFTPTETITASPSPSPSATETATLVPSETPTEPPSPTPLASDTPEPTLAALPTQRSSGTTASIPASSTVSGGKHWIDVNLTQQMVYAYEGDTIVNSFLVSTGAAPRLTVTGSYAIYERHVKANMWGPGYFLPDVPYTMYFYKGFALHGTYWHSNFGTPMSHGCVNLSIPDAEWLYYWATLGTPVKVHY